PVNCRCFGESIGHIKTQPIPLDCLDRGPRRAAVVTPALSTKTRRKLVIHGLCDEVPYLHSVDQAERERRTVGSCHSYLTAGKSKGRTGRSRARRGRNGRVCGRNSWRRSRVLRTGRSHLSKEGRSSTNAAVLDEVTSMHFQ